MLLVVFIVRIYHDAAPSSECQIKQFQATLFFDDAFHYILVSTTKQSAVGRFFLPPKLAICVTSWLHVKDYIFAFHFFYITWSSTAMRHIITFRSTTDWIYDGGPIRLYYIIYHIISYHIISYIVSYIIYISYHNIYIIIYIIPTATGWQSKSSK